MKNGGGNRKQRSDKKIDVKPTMSIDLKNQLYSFAYLSGEPVKDVAEKLCVYGATSKEIIDDICKWFRRNYIYNNTIAIGNSERPKLKINIQGESDKVTIRFKQNDYDLLCELAHALDATPTSTSGILIKSTLTNIEFMQQYAQKHLMHLTDKKKKEIDLFLNRIWGLNK